MLLWKSSKYHILWVCVFSLRYLSYNSHVLHYIVICVLSGSTFFVSSHKGHDFWRNVIEQVTCILVYSTNFFQHIAYYKKNLTRYYHKFVWSIYVKYPLFWSGFIKTRIFSTVFVFEKSTNNKFYKNPFCTSLVVPCEWMDGQKIDTHDKPNSRFSQFSEGARISVI
jgi:hypothetical protein